MADTRKSGGYTDSRGIWHPPTTPAGEGYSARDKEKLQDTSPLVAAARAEAERKKKAAAKAASQAKAVEEMAAR
jgi:hypothetical protein